MQGRMLEKKRQGKPRTGVIDDIVKGSFAKTKRRAERIKEWRMVPGACL